MGHVSWELVVGRYGLTFGYEQKSAIKDTEVKKTNGTRYFVKWEIQLLHSENLELKIGLYLI